MAPTATQLRKKQSKMQLKNELYDHLANAFFERKPTRKQKNSLVRKSTQWIVAGCLALFLFLLLAFGLSRQEISIRSLHVTNDKAPNEIAFDFSSPGASKVRKLSYNFDNLNVSGFRSVAFSIRSKEPSTIDNIIKIQIENSFLEKSTSFVEGVNSAWKQVSVPLQNFHLINDWSRIRSLSFIVEEWNVANKQNAIYIDDVRFVE